MDTLQTQLQGLRRRSFHEKEEQTAAVRAVNCDLYRNTLEPRPGREPYIGPGLGSGALQLDGDSVWCQVVPEVAIGLNSYIVSIVWRYDDLIEEWFTGQQSTLVAYYDDEQNLYYELWVGQGMPPTFNVTVRNAGGLVTHSDNFPGTRQDGDIYRIVTYIERDAPNAGDTTVRQRVYRNGGGAVINNSTAYVADANQGLPAGGRWSVGARAWFEPEAALNMQERWIEGAVADFITWGGDASPTMDDIWGDATWRWQVLRQEEYLWCPFDHIEFNKLVGWVPDDTGSATQTAFLMPLPTMEAAESPNRFEFTSYTSGRVDVPITEAMVGGGSLVVAGKFVVPSGKTPGVDPGTYVSVIASAANWAVILVYRSAGYQLALRYMDASQTWKDSYVYAPLAPNTLVEGNEYMFGVVIERVGQASGSGFARLWVENSTGAWEWAMPVAGAGTVVWRPETTIWWGGFPVCGNWSGLYTILTYCAISISHDNPDPVVNPWFALNYIENGMLDEHGNVPVLAKFVPDFAGGNTAPGFNNDALDGTFTPDRRTMLEVRDALGREIRMDCQDKEPPGLSTIIPHLLPREPNSVRGVSTFHSIDGKTRAAVLTESGVVNWDGTPSLEQSPGGTSGRLHEGHIPVQAKAWRRRVFFFGGSGVRPKFDGRMSSRIGLSAPYLHELMAEEDTVYAGKVNSDDYGEPGEANLIWFKVSLYNSETGQESNLSNPLAHQFETVSTDLTLLLSLRIAFWDGDDFDTINVYRSDDDFGEYYLDTRARRPHWRGKQSRGFLFFGDLSGAPTNLADYRVPITLPWSVVSAQKPEEADNWPAPDCLVGEFHTNRLYVVPRDDPSLVVYSKPHLVESFPATNFARVGERPGDEVRGLISTPLGLLVLTRRETWLIARGQEDAPVPEVLSREAGILSPASIAQSDREVLWVSERGVEGLIDNQLRLVSDQIREVFDDYTFDELRMAKGAVWRKRRQYWLLLGKDFYVLNLDTGQWTEGVMGATWIGHGAFTDNANDELVTGWEDIAYRHVPRRREDGNDWGTSTLDNGLLFSHTPPPDEYLYWTLEEGIYGLGFDDKEIDDGQLPLCAFLSLGHPLSDDPLIYPVTLYRYNPDYNGRHTYWFASPIDTPMTDAYVYLWIPCLYETTPIVVEGPHIMKRVRSVRLHFDPDTDTATTTDVQFRSDGAAAGDVHTLTLGAHGRRSDYRVDVSLHRLCRNWAMRLTHAESTWPAFSFLEWFYSLRKAPR